MAGIGDILSQVPAPDAPLPDAAAPSQFPVGSESLTQGPVPQIGQSLTQGPDPSSDAFAGGWLGKLLSRGVSGLLGGPSRRDVLGPPIMEQEAEWQAAKARGEPVGNVSPVAQNLGMNAGSIKAFHGGANMLPELGAPLGKFSNRFLRTGEGANSFGSGHYVAEAEPTAETYLKGFNNKVGGRSGPTLDGKPFDRALFMGNMDRFGFKTTEAQRRGMKELALARGDMDEVFKKLSASGTHPDDTALVALHDLVSSGRLDWPRYGRMYEVNLKAEPEQFLDYNNPSRMLKDYYVTERSDPVQANAYALKHGMQGIKYLDDFSRRAPADAPKTRNYVVFDPSIIEILRKYGLAPAAVTGGGVGSILSQTKGDQGG